MEASTKVEVRRFVERAMEDVDRELIAAELRLTPRQRLRAATKMLRAITRFKRVAP